MTEVEVMQIPRTEHRDSVKTAWQKPAEPLPSELPDVSRFDPDLLPEVLREYAVDVAERMQCPLDFPAVGLMVAAGATIGRGLAIRPKAHDDWTVVPNLWGAMVGRPAVLKSPSLSESLVSLNRLEHEAAREYEEAMQQHKIDIEVAKVAKQDAAQRAKKALKKNSDPRAAFNDYHEPEPPRCKRFITHDATVEKLGELLADNPNGILIVRDELTGFLRNMERDGHQTDRAFYLEAWNGTSTFTFDRIGRGTTRIEAACVSVVGTIQPGPLRTYLIDTLNGGAGDDGLIQRFQLMVWPDVSGDWVNIDRSPNMEARNRAFVAFGTWAEAHFKHAIFEDGALPHLRFEPLAQAEFDRWRTRLERRLRRQDEHPALEAHLTKYRSLIPSLALICHVADGCKGSVTIDALQRAIGWGDYLESHARRIYAAVDSPAETCGRALAQHLRHGALGAEFTLRDIYRRHWSLLGTIEQTTAAVEYLVRHEWLGVNDIETGGRPTTYYTLNPLLSFYAETVGYPSAKTDKRVSEAEHGRRQMQL